MHGHGGLQGAAGGAGGAELDAGSLVLWELTATLGGVTFLQWVEEF